MTVYRPRFVPQYNDPTTTLDWFDCTMASGAMALDYDTLGRIQVLGGQLRAVSGDYVGGTNLGSPGLTQAWNHYGQVLHVMSGQHWTDVLAALRGYRGVVLQGWYGALPLAYRSKVTSIGFTGAHAVYLNPQFSSTGAVLMGDPLNDQYIWVPQSALSSFAAALGRAAPPVGFGPSTPQALFFAATDPHVPAPDTSTPTYTLHIAANATVKSYALSSAGCLTGTKFTKWGPKPSTATCSAPDGKRGCSSGSATVVHVPAGAFAGRWVATGPGVTVTHT